ncbi:MAG: transglutaminase-like domain-containing protein, partial [Chloroflexota bacterium]|nr:transglutaminase-like domain-containing protein [Chloroflexota bacterium]
MSRPREGWLSVGLLLVMLLAIAWSVEHAKWLPHLEFLVPLAILSVLAGTAAALSSLAPVGAVALGAAAGGSIVIWTVGGEYFATLDPLARMLSLREELVDWIGIVAAGGYPTDLTPYAIGLGILLWTTGFMSAFTAFRHHRALDAVLIASTALVANMAATYTDLFAFLLLFVLAALLFLLRGALADRQLAWHARRLTQTDEVPTTIMRTGVTFVAVSVGAAWLLTTVAVAAPLTAVWTGLDGVWRDARDRLDGVLGGLSNPDARFSGATFGNAYRIDGSFVSSKEPVLTIASQRAYYLRTATYDRYTGHGFARSTVQERNVAAGELLFPDQTPEQPANPDAYDTQTVTISYAKSMGGALFTPGYPVLVTVPAIVLETDGQPVMGGFEAASSVPAGTGYAVTALISEATKAQLNAAGEDYPEAIASMYLGTEGVSTRTRELALEIVREAGAETPFQMAEALASFLRTDDSFRYQTEAPTPRDPNADIVDFFLFDPEGGRVGYCEYYATAMAVMARTLGLPARVAVGFAPGELVTAAGEEGESNAYLVREGNAHAWAELYFPGYGWERFEAT